MNYKLQPKQFKLNEDVLAEDILMLQPATLFLLSQVVLWCSAHKLSCVITSFISDRENVKAKTMTHSEGRAFDLSIKGWTKFDIARFVFHFNTKYKDIAAIAASDNQPKAVVYGDKNHRDHMHMQVKRGILSIALLEDYYAK
jgi:hypothetical protein